MMTNTLKKQGGKTEKMDEEKILAGKEDGPILYAPIVRGHWEDLHAKSLRSFSVGDIVVDVYREQVFEVVKLMKWAVIRHLASGMLVTRSLCDSHFELADKPTQLNMSYEILRMRE